MTLPNSEARRLLFEVGAYVATRRGPAHWDALHAISKVMVAFEDLAVEAKALQLEADSLRALTHQAVDFAHRHRAAANYYASACHNIGEQYLELAEHAGVVVRERPPC